MDPALQEFYCISRSASQQQRPLSVVSLSPSPSATRLARHPIYSYHDPPSASTSQFNLAPPSRNVYSWHHNPQSVPSIAQIARLPPLSPLGGPRSRAHRRFGTHNSGNNTPSMPTTPAQGDGRSMLASQQRQPQQQQQQQQQSHHQTPSLSNSDSRRRRHHTAGGPSTFNRSRPWSISTNDIPFDPLSSPPRHQVADPRSTAGQKSLNAQDILWQEAEDEELEVEGHDSQGGVGLQEEDGSADENIEDEDVGIEQIQGQGGHFEDLAQDYGAFNANHNHGHGDYSNNNDSDGDSHGPNREHFMNSDRTSFPDLSSVGFAEEEAGVSGLDQKPTPLPLMPLFVLSVVIFSEPLTSTILFPFVYFMVRDFHITENEDEIGFFCGLIASSFFLAQFSTAIFWGYMSDRFGRRPILLTGLIGSTITCIFFGLSKSLMWAIASRSMCGLLNGNVGVAKSMLGEMTDETNQSKAFGLFGFAWGIGMIVGPVLGGYLANPADKFPSIFGDWPFFIEYPYFLPCFVAAIGSVVGFAVGFFFLKETRIFPTDGSDGYGNDFNHKGSSAEEQQKLLYQIQHPVVEMVKPSQSRQFSIHTGTNTHTSTDATPSRSSWTDNSRFLNKDEDLSVLDEQDHERQPLMAAAPIAPGSQISTSVASTQQQQQVRFLNSRYGSISNLAVMSPPTATATAVPDSAMTSLQPSSPPRILSPRHRQSKSVSSFTSKLSFSGSEAMTPRPMSSYQQPSSFPHQKQQQQQRQYSYRYHPQDRSESLSSATQPSDPYRRIRTTSTDSAAAGLSGPFGPGGPQGNNLITADGRPFNPRDYQTLSLYGEYGESGNGRPYSVHNGLQPSTATQVFILPPDPNNKDPNQPMQLLVVPASGISPLSITAIIAYAMLAFHSIVFEEVYTLFTVTPLASHGLGWTSTQLATSLALMGPVQLFLQFVAYPRLERRFSAVYLFRFGQLMYAVVYIAFPLIRHFLVFEDETHSSFFNPGHGGGGDGKDSTAGQTNLIRYTVLLGLMVKYSCSVLSYTSVMVMITNSSPSHLLGTVNGIGQMSASFMRAVGPALGGILWAWSLSNKLLFPFNFFFVFFLIAGIATLSFIHSLSIPRNLGSERILQ